MPEEQTEQTEQPRKVTFTRRGDKPEINEQRDEPEVEDNDDTDSQ